MVKKKKVYQGKAFNISLYNFLIGNKRVTHEIIEQNNAAAILALDKDQIIMIKQFRYPHKEVLEIPAGIINKNETSEECANREFLEETGYIAKKLTHLIRYYPFLGYNLQYIDCFLATNIKKISEQKLDDEESITIEKIPLEKLIRMIKNKKIIDSKTIISVMIYAAKKKLN
ncbi:MAG: NUDIX hydrolase [Thaumarchaeota archaeon]|jgi:ADP-ribose pyrophosphatase|nr:MAG: NUDIX hydrolase [Nitrososphaerota archaeon]